MTGKVYRPGTEPYDHHRRSQALLQRLQPTHRELNPELFPRGSSQETNLTFPVDLENEIPIDDDAPARPYEMPLTQLRLDHAQPLQDDLLRIAQDKAGIIPVRLDINDLILSGIKHAVQGPERRLIVLGGWWDSLFSPIPVPDPPDGLRQVRHVDGFQQIIGGGEADRLQEIFRVAIGCREDDMRQGNRLFQLTQQIHRGIPLQLDIQEKDIRPVAQDARQGGLVGIVTIHHLDIGMVHVQFLE